jgi:hypothetical protein
MGKKKSRKEKQQRCWGYGKREVIKGGHFKVQAGKVGR